MKSIPVMCKTLAMCHYLIARRLLFLGGPTVLLESAGLFSSVHAASP
jgi:hypothetical protein